MNSLLLHCCSTPTGAAWRQKDLQSEYRLRELRSTREKPSKLQFHITIITSKEDKGQRSDLPDETSNGQS